MKKLELFAQNNKDQIIIAILLGLWISIFLILIGPFDAATVSMKNRLTMMPFYGLIFSICYISSFPIQDRLKNKWPKDYLKGEVLLSLYIFILALLLTFTYYKSDIIQGEYAFDKFLFQIYLPIITLVLTILIAIRWTLIKSKSIKDKFVTLGTGKYSKIKIKLSDLVFAKASDNYVEIHFLDKNEIKVKLIRCSLKHLKEKAPELIQTHRSFLINQRHVISLDSKNSLQLTKANIPISDTYRQNISKIFT